jgi:hypothetical protein
VREYLFSVLGAALSSSVILLLLPERAASGKFMKLLVSLAVICTVAAPITLATEGTVGDFFFSFTEGVRGDSSAEEKYYDILTNLGEAELERLLTERISEDLSLKAGDISVKVEADEADGVFCPTRVTVGISGMAVFTDPREIEELVEGLVGCDCDTYY